MAKPASSLEQKLKALDPQVKKYVAHIQKENARLELQIAQLKLKQKALDVRVKAAEKAQGSPDLGDRLRRARKREYDVTKPDTDLMREAGRLLDVAVERSKKR